MEPARFATLVFLYVGIVLLAQFAVVDGFEIWGPGFGNFGVGILMLFLGLYRLVRSAQAEQSPDSWGVVTAGLAFLAALITVIFWVRVVIA